MNLEFYILIALGLFKLVNDMIGVVREDCNCSVLWLLIWFFLPKYPLLCHTILDLVSNVNFFAVNKSDISMFLAAFMFWNESLSSIAVLTFNPWFASFS